jgi:hypothetical protein
LEVGLGQKRERVSFLDTGTLCTTEKPNWTTYKCLLLSSTVETTLRPTLCDRYEYGIIKDYMGIATENQAWRTTTTLNISIISDIVITESTTAPSSATEPPVKFLQNLILLQSRQNTHYTIGFDVRLKFLCGRSSCVCLFILRSHRSEEDLSVAASTIFFRGAGTD